MDQKPVEATLNGVRYTPATRTPLARMAWMGKWARVAGLDDLKALGAPETEAQSAKVLQEIVGRAFEKDAVVPLLAGGLEQVGHPWTEVQAQANMPILADATEPEALEVLAVVLFDFIAREPALLRPMLLSSMPVGTAIGASSRTHPSSPTPATTSGTPSPGDSPAPTSRGSTFSAGTR